MFQGGFEASVNKHIPHKVCKRKYKLPWITQELKSLIRKRHTKRKRNQTIHKTPRNLNISSKPYRENPDRHIGNI
jgi:hypothetical protein